MAATRAPLPLLLLLLLVLAGCSSALECPGSGRFWDGCNWCFCRGRTVLGCTNMACAGLGGYRLDADQPTIGPPDRTGLFAYRPGHGRVVDPAGWPCQMGSSWLEEGGCVRCICANRMIKCRDSGMCLHGELLSNDLSIGQPEPSRRRRDVAGEPAAGAPAPTSAPAPAPAPEATVETTAAPANSSAAPDASTATAAAPSAETALSSENATATSTPASGQPAPPEHAANATQAATPAPAPTPAQITVVKERSCNSGNTWEEDCNTCWCLDKNRAACTANSCEPPPGPPLPLGAPSGQNAPKAAAPATTSAAPTAASPAAAAAAATTTAAPSSPSADVTASEATTASAPQQQQQQQQREEAEQGVSRTASEGAARRRRSVAAAAAANSSRRRQEVGILAGFGHRRRRRLARHVAA